MRSCRYCHKDFKREHIFSRHERIHCTKRIKPIRPDIHSQIEKSELLIKQYEDELASSHSDLVQKNLDEALKLHMSIIMLKNNHSYFSFKCSHCSEGFEWNQQRRSHEPSCRWNPLKIDPSTLISMQSTHSTHSPSPTPPTLQQIADDLKSLSDDVRHLESTISSFRDVIEAARDVLPILRDLRSADMQFTMRLLRASVLANQKT